MSWRPIRLEYPVRITERITRNRDFETVACLSRTTSCSKRAEGLFLLAVIVLFVLFVANRVDAYRVEIV
jgi:hypothetical protein